MTLRLMSRARVPGPLAASAGGTGGGRLPGPLGFRGVVLAAPAAVALTKTLKMPAPAGDSSTKRAHEVTAKLFLKAGPAPGDVAQGRIATCPLASLLAA